VLADSLVDATPFLYMIKTYTVRADEQSEIPAVLVPVTTDLLNPQTTTE